MIGSHSDGLTVKDDDEDADDGHDSDQIIITGTVNCAVLVGMISKVVGLLMTVISLLLLLFS